MDDTCVTANRVETTGACKLKIYAPGSPGNVDSFVKGASFRVV